MSNTEPTMTEYTDYTAYVSAPNTPETDMMDKVMHTVTFKKNGVPCMIDIRATDPMDAIEKVRHSHKGIGLYE